MTQGSVLLFPPSSIWWVMALKSSSLVIWGYVGIHSSGFRDFLLKPELFRSIVDSGFEHPSEAHLYVDKLCRSLGCIKSRLSFLHSLIEYARGKVDKEITTSHPSLCVIRGILQSKTSSSNSKVLILAKQVFWWSLKNLLMSMGLSWNELSSFCTNANPSGMVLHLFHSTSSTLLWNMEAFVAHLEYLLPPQISWLDSSSLSED
ncbi:hypothetical protein ES332_A10G140400v1 [Gossypium tomentosum]|uniref:Uncharacterized protein n=1 Tax=Gossypium tomentosum TaxID=34277 RepID=A0A5D2NSW1_GOSTO|nr:hypothetical protein ES332_A10G140400v1 [Gossypium tomentosum]